VNSLWI